MSQTPLCFETAFSASRTYENPLWDVTARVTFTPEVGDPQQVDAFWDGGQTWRVRFGARAAGRWTYQVESSDPGLDGVRGDVVLEPYRGDNPVFAHGRLRLSDDRRHFVHADGTPWFFMSDTAWNGVLRSQPADWERYLQIRRGQGFTAVQFNLTQWRSFSEPAFTGTERIQIQPEFYQTLDGKVAAINQHGLVAVPVLLWACTPTDPGAWLPEEDAIRLARYLVARYGAHEVLWFLGGDGNYMGEKAPRWQRIGRALFGDRHHRLVTTHPGGQHWVADEFRGEDWFDFVTYQSGHGSSDGDLRWLVQGPPAQEWTKEPPRPIINTEANYEHHKSYHEDLRFTDYHIRRASYWSLFVAPAAGVTYGHHGVWPWMTEPGLPPDHPRTGIAPAWYEAVEDAGPSSIKIMRDFLDSLSWWRLRPAPELLVAQPGEVDPRHFIAVASSGQMTLAYLPVGGTVSLRTTGTARWFNPARGLWSAPAPFAGTATAPGTGDWILVVE